MATGEIFYLEQIKGFLFRKQLVNNWILQKENIWLTSLLPETLFHLLEYDTKIYEGNIAVKFGYIDVHLVTPHVEVIEYCIL